MYRKLETILESNVTMSEELNVTMSEELNANFPFAVKTWKTVVY